MLINNPHEIESLKWSAHTAAQKLIEVYPYADNAFMGAVDGVYDSIEELSKFCGCETPTHGEISKQFPQFYGK